MAALWKSKGNPISISFGFQRQLPERIHAHASICFMALILYRVMRSRLKDSHSQISPERALDKLRRIQHQVAQVNDLDPVAALSNINQEHTAILQALTIKKTDPSHPVDPFVVARLQRTSI